MIEDSRQTVTSCSQHDLEHEVVALYGQFWKHVQRSLDDPSHLVLEKHKHRNYLKSALGNLAGVKLKTACVHTRTL